MTASASRGQAAAAAEDQPGDLAASLVAESFAIQGGVLHVGGVSVEALARRYGTPLFVYDAGVMRRAYRSLGAAVAGFAEVVYSVKANPNPAVIRVFREEGAGAEIASGAEFEAALAAGVAPERILFAGPGKSDADLARVVAAGIGEIHLENVEEMRRVAALGADHGRRVAVAIRVNPTASVQGGAMRMGGKPSPFGFDEEDLDAVVDLALAEPWLDLSGVHLFAGTQVTAPETLAMQWRHALALARRIGTRAGRPVRTIDMGGGLGIPYFAGDAPLDLAALAREVAVLRTEVAGDPWLRDARIVLEPGRYLVGPSGVYVGQVRAVKESRGSRFLITDGGMHHHLAASGNLGQVFKRDYPMVPVRARPGEATKPAVIVGPLCTPLDTIGRAVPLPALTAGDLVAVLQSGAYALTASPTGFLSHPLPPEVLVEEGAAVRVDRRAA